MALPKISADIRNPESLRSLLATHNDRQLAAIYGVGRKAITYWRDKSGIPASYIGSTKHTLNRSFFKEIDLPEKAYALGFLIADGCVHSDGRGAITISVVESDLVILLAIRDAMGGNVPLRTL